MQVIGMFMGEDHSVNDTNFFSDQLVTQIGGSIEQQIPAWETEYRPRTRPIILRILTIADGTNAPDGGYADAGA